MHVVSLSHNGLTVSTSVFPAQKKTDPIGSVFCLTRDLGLEVSAHCLG
jgi:hypothetical protein